MPSVNNIQSNYIESFNFLEIRKRRQVNQLVLLNNLQRGDQNIASTLLLTLFNRVFSSLYDDKIQVKFLPTQGITQDQINAYNTLAQSDYQEMGKAKIDYDWVWDTLFFGRGYVETIKFDKKRKIMVPHTINPLVLGYDPYFENPQEWRYYWKWVTKTKWDINRLIKAGKITGIKKAEDIPSGVDPYLWEYKQRRDSATKAIEPSLEPADADIYQILEYFGYDDDGNKCCYWVDKHFATILMEERLEFDDLELDDGTMGSKWPIVIKEGYRIPHASVPFSVADLLEDKHRAKSVLLNLAFIAAKDAANPLYTYNPDQVKDVSQFFSRQINQHIPIEGDPMTAVQPLNVKDPMPPGLLNFMQALQQEANDPVGTGVKMEPASASTDQTATAAAIDQQLNDMAQSLQSKILQFGEQEFWGAWFQRYKKHGPELQNKLANIVGVNGVTTSTIDLNDFQTDFPPGVMVYSAKEAEYKNLVKRRDMMQLYPNLMQSMDQDGFRNFNKHVFFPLMLEDPSLIDVMFSKTPDEMKAEEENEQLKQGVMPPVSETDNHTTHLYIHRMAQTKEGESTWAKWFHIKEHEDMLEKQKKQEQMMLQSEQMGAGAAQQPQGAEKSSPMGATAPLKQEAKTPLTSNNKNQ